MTQVEWLDIDIIIDVHAEQLALFGGPEGIRDQGMLESALGRPLNKFAYGETSLTTLAAAYAFGIARNHPFVDGNKRAAFASIIVFLELNGVELIATQEDATAAMLELAAGAVSEEALADWIATNSRPLP